MSSLIVHRGCSVPLSALPPHVANSEKAMMPMLTSQSTTFGIQTRSFQLPPTFGENASLLKVFTPNVKWLTTADRIQSHVARCRSASKLEDWKVLNGSGRPAGPDEPGCCRFWPRLNRYDRRCALVSA